jgi:hypothetical protein
LPLFIKRRCIYDRNNPYGCGGNWCAGTTGGAFYFIHKIIKKIETIDKLESENVLLIKSTFAICDGLSQLGCNGPVTKAKEELQDYIIKN